MQPSAFHLTKQGASHIKKSKECQDASVSRCTADYAIAIVCDGHGGDDYVRSAAGASLACRIALKNIESFLKDADKEELESRHDEMIKTLEASIISRWSTSIHDDYERRPFTEKELAVLSEKAKKRYLEGRIESAYGTTLIAVALTREFWFGIHIGDGKCVAINRESKFGQPIPWDSKCFLNATTSLCDSEAINNFRHFFSYKLPAAIFIGSDGIDDCFKNNEQLYNLYRTVLYSFATSDFEAAKADLEDYLPRLSAKGSGDDVSIAAVMDLDIIKELDTIKEYNQEKEKARVKENARIEAEKAAEEKQRIEAEYAEKLKQREETRRAEEERRRQQIGGQRPKYCEHCGAQFRSRSKYCSSCGKEVRNMPVPQQAETITDLEKLQSNHCKNCGTQLRPGAKYCDSCGEAVRCVQDSRHLWEITGPAEPRQKSCEGCGAQLHIEAKFCGWCGKSQFGRSTLFGPVPDLLGAAPVQVPNPSPEPVHIEELPAEIEIAAAPEDQPSEERPTELGAVQDTAADEFDLKEAEECQKEETEVLQAKETAVPQKAVSAIEDSETADSVAEEGSVPVQDNMVEDNIAGTAPVAEEEQ